jgi:hypothetical protein
MKSKKGKTASAVPDNFPTMDWDATWRIIDGLDWSMIDRIIDDVDNVLEALGDIDIDYILSGASNGRPGKGKG